MALDGLPKNDARKEGIRSAPTGGSGSSPADGVVGPISQDEKEREREREIGLPEDFSINV